VTLTLEGAGTFDDLEMLQKVLDYRGRVRSVRNEEQLKWAMLLHGFEIKRPPRVVRVTDQVESQLNELVSHPGGIARQPPNFRVMTRRLLNAFADQPFESGRRIPEADPEARQAIEMLAHAAFEPEELQKMTLELLGCRIVARTHVSPPSMPGDLGFVQTKLVYDSDAIGTVKVTYDIRLPDEGSPGWIQTQSPVVAEAGYTQFSIRAPFQTRFGEHSLKVKAAITWDDGHIEVVRDVPWFSVDDKATPPDGHN
jgi:hypothetical protein